MRSVIAVFLSTVEILSVHLPNRALLAVEVWYKPLVYEHYQSRYLYCISLERYGKKL